MARALSIALGAARRAITVGGTTNPEAQQLLLQALEAARRGDRKAVQQAMSLTDAATKLDPGYADAYAHKALFTNWYASAYATDVAELVRTRAEAMDTAKVALRLAPNLASGHRALAEIHRVLLEVGPALREYRRALELAPGDAGTLSDYAVLLGVLGSAPEALRLSDQAINLDPLNIDPYFSRFAILVAVRRLDEAISFSKELERTKPHLFGWPEGVAYALIVQDRLDEA